MRRRVLLVGLLVPAALVAILTWGPYLTRADAVRPRASFVRSLGESGADRERLRRPIGVAVSPEGEVFISDAEKHRIAVFDREGAFVREFGTRGNGPGELDRPMHLSFGPDGFLYVAEYLNDRVSVFRPDGAFVKHITTNTLDAPAGVVVDGGGVLHVANFYRHQVVRIAPDGSATSWGQPGRVLPGSLHYPTDVALAPDGSIWVADAYNNRLQHFVDGGAKHVVGWGTFGKAFGFRVAVGVAVDTEGRVYGADFDHGKVRVFDGDGTPLETFGTRGRGPGELDRPQDVAVAGDRIYVVDLGNDRVQEWRIAPAKETSGR